MQYEDGEDRRPKGIIHVAEGAVAYRPCSGPEVGRTYAFIRLVGLDEEDFGPIVGRIERGIPFEAFERLREHLDVSAQELAGAVGISPRTLARRREQQTLEPDESDRVLRVARIFTLAVTLFEGDVDEARGWLTGPKWDLGGETPLRMLRTELGAREVEDLIGRLEHGAYS